jgi:hypothetical protein
VRPWLALALLLGLFLFYWHGARPVDHFGKFHDDTFYLSSAKSIAEGQGYRLASVPGAPPATKYPILYPWLLSWVWRWGPGFPENLGLAVWVTAMFSCWFLVAAFEFLRKLAGVGDWTALALVGLVAFHSLFVFLSSAVLSDIPFLALALTAMIVADRGLRPDARLAAAAGAGILAGLSMMIRSPGVAVAAGILAAAVSRRAWRQAGVFCLTAGPLLVAALWRGDAAQVRALAEGGDLGWYQTWLFYTSYWDFWKFCVPSWSVLGSMMGFNLLTFLKWPSTFCLFPPLGGGESYAGQLLAITLTAGVLGGAIRQARRQGFQPIHFVFVANAAMVLLWNYALMDRLLMLFLPLFYAGLWTEVRHLAGLIAENLRPARQWAEKALAGALALSLAALAALAARHYVVGYRPGLLRPALRSSELAREKAEAYAWISRNTPPQARFVAYQDVILYLHTGRQAMRPIVFSTEAFYSRSEKILQREMDHFDDVARHIGARYWLAAEDDFKMETGLDLIEHRVKLRKALLPVVFKSQNNKVQVLLIPETGAKPAI